MMNKLNKTLTGLLALQLIIMVLAFSLGGRDGDLVAGPLFPDFRKEAAEKLTVYSERDKKVELTKEEGRWTVPAEQGYPADNEKVDGVLEKISELETGSLISSDRSSHKRLKVSENQYNRLVEIEGAGGDAKFRLFLGSSPVYRKVYVRSGTGDEVYQTGGIAAWELPAEPSSWLDHKYLDLKEEAVSSVEIENASGSMRFKRDESGAWTLEGLNEGVRLRQDEWKKLLKKALYIRMDKPLGSREEAKWGLDRPALTLRMETAASREGGAGTETVTIRFGKKDEEKNLHVAKSSLSSFFVKVSAYSVSELVEAEKSGLVEKKTEGE